MLDTQETKLFCTAIEIQDFLFQESCYYIPDRKIILHCTASGIQLDPFKCKISKFNLIANYIFESHC